MALSEAEANNVLKTITFMGWLPILQPVFSVRVEYTDVWEIRCVLLVADSDNQRSPYHLGRTQYIAIPDTVPQLLQAARHLLLSFMDHEIREAMRCDRRAVFSPHMDPGSITGDLRNGYYFGPDGSLVSPIVPIFDKPKQPPPKPKQKENRPVHRRPTRRFLRWLGYARSDWSDQEGKG